MRFVAANEHNTFKRDPYMPQAFSSGGLNFTKKQWPAEVVELVQAKEMVNEEWRDRLYVISELAAAWPNSRMAFSLTCLKPSF